MRLNAHGELIKVPNEAWIRLTASSNGDSSWSWYGHGQPCVCVFRIMPPLPLTVRPCASSPVRPRPKAAGFATPESEQLGSSRHVMPCHVDCRRRRPPTTGRITTGHRHDGAGEARIFGLLDPGPQQTQAQAACHELITASTASRLHSGLLTDCLHTIHLLPTIPYHSRTRRGLLTCAAPSLPMTTFCHFAPPGQRRAVVYLGRAQLLVATSFATGMLHRPCVARLIARLIAGIRGSTPTVHGTARK